MSQAVQAFGVVDDIVKASVDDEVYTGWRFFVVRHRAGGPLYSAFGWTETPFPRKWSKADCRPDMVPVQFRGQEDRLFDYGEHVIPGESCGCGWRVYPTLAMAALGAEMWPDNPVTSLERENVVFAGVEYSGKLANRPDTKSRSIDEAGTLRARWLRVAGPIYLGPGLSRPIRRFLSRRYGASVITLDRGPAAALRDGTISVPNGEP